MDVHDTDQCEKRDGPHQGGLELHRGLESSGGGRLLLGLGDTPLHLVEAGEARPVERLVGLALDGLADRIDRGIQVALLGVRLGQPLIRESELRVVRDDVEIGCRGEVIRKEIDPRTGVAIRIAHIAPVAEETLKAMLGH